VRGGREAAPSLFRTARLCSARVVDESTKARAHTLFQQTMLGDAVEHAKLGVMIWNEERRYVALNTAACELIGASREELLGAHVGDHNRTAAGREAIAAVLGELPAFGTTPLPSGTVVEWVTVETDIAGLPHILGLMWPARSNVGA
jgi:PAS domain-containing protein